MKGKLGDLEKMSYFKNKFTILHLEIFRFIFKGMKNGICN